MAKQIAKTYGSAVFDSIREAGEVDRLPEQIEGLRESLNELDAIMETPGLIRVLTHPNIAVEEKQRIVERVYKEALTAPLYGLLQLLLQKDRMAYLDEILDELLRLYKEEKGIGVVYVTTPMALKEDQLAALEKKLLADTKYRRLEMHTSVDASLIAGMVIRIGDRVVDSSVATRLENMTRRLKTLQLK